MKFPVRIGRVSKVDFKTNFTMNKTKDKAHSIFCVNDIDLHSVHKGRGRKRGYSRSEMIGLNG